MKIAGHLDMDAFFASVEERDRPRLRGKPIVVGADPAGGRGRGVVSTANYEARKYGIGSAMPITKAWKLAEVARRAGRPEAVFISGGFGKYGEVSRRIMDIVRGRVPTIQKVSVDEAYLDLSFAGTFAQAREVGVDLRREIARQERLTASIGIGPNKLVAKIASDFEKPDGLTVVEPDEVLDFLSSLPVRALPGVGPKAEGRLRRYGVRTVTDLRGLSLERLRELFGTWGEGLYRRARGIDDRLVTEDRAPAKSVGEQETFREDTLDGTILLPVLRGLCGEVHRRFLKANFSTFRTAALTVRFADFVTRSRSRTLSSATSSLKVLEFEILKLFMPFLDRRENPERRRIRLLGVRVEKLV
jgi:DNA polymerase IV (archaeal DinB-like DNA polymerase)